MSGLTVYDCIIIAQNVHSPNISTLQKKNISFNTD